MGVNAVPMAPPMGGSGVGATHACAERLGRPIVRRTLSSTASPCLRPLSFSIMSSVSGPGVNPSPSDPASEAGVGLAGVTVPSLEYGEAPGWAALDAGVRLSADAKPPVSDPASDPSIPSGIGRTDPVAVFVSPPAVAAASLALASASRASFFIFASASSVCVPGSEKASEEGAGVGSVASPAAKSRSRVVSPSEATDAAAASAPGGTSNESDRFSSAAASSSVAVSGTESAAGDGSASAGTSGTSCRTPRVMRRFLASDLRPAPGSEDSDSRSAAEKANSSVVSGWGAGAEPAGAGAVWLSAATAAASSAARFAATSSVTLPMGRPCIEGLFSADAAATATSSSSASASADKPGTAAVMSPRATATSPEPASPGASTPKSSSSSSASADKPGTAAVIAPATASSSPEKPTPAEVSVSVSSSARPVGAAESSSSSSSSSSSMIASSVGSRASSAAARMASRYCAGSIVTRRGRCAVNIDPGEGTTAGDALAAPREGDRAALEGAALEGAALEGAAPREALARALTGVPRGMKSDALETRAMASEETRGADDVWAFSPRAPSGVLTSAAPSAAAADPNGDGAAGLSLTPNAAKGSTFAFASTSTGVARASPSPRSSTPVSPPETGVAAGENAAIAAIAASAAADAGPAPKGDAGGGAPPGAGPGGGHVAVVAGAGGFGGTEASRATVASVEDCARRAPPVFAPSSAAAPWLGSGNASASRSSFWNSRTDSSADSTAKETRLDASDCLRFFLAASLSRPAPPGDLPSTLLTSLKMLLRLRLRMEEGVALATFSLASEAMGVVAGLDGVAAAGEGSTFSACASAGGAPPLCRGERRRGSSEPAMAVRCVKAHPSDRDGINALDAPPRCHALRPARGGPQASRVYTRRVARLRVSHSGRRCVQPLRASRNARDAHSRDAWAFKSSRWTHRQLPFQPDSPRRGERFRMVISLEKSNFVYPGVHVLRT